ncbi:Aldolase-type TIM barrel [Phytophthora cactorum]|nr:Aldolase-type TIM barrel [Phytophthora cactorum]
MKTLRRNLNIPVSCKIRLLPEIQDTVDLAKRLEDAGAYAVGVHMRHIHERPHDKASWDRLAPVVSALSVPVLANGDVLMHEDIDKLRKILARHPSSLLEGRLPIDEVVREYLKAAAETDNVYQNTKYNVMRMIPSSLEDAYASGNKYGYAKDAHVVTVPELAATRNGLQMYSLWDLQNYYNQYQDQFRAKAAALEKNAKPEDQTSETLTTLPGAHDRYAEEIDDEAPQARNNRTGKPELYCDACKIQLLSEQDVKLHFKGESTRTCCLEQNPATGVENGKVVSEVRPHEGEDKRDSKRAKLEDTPAVANDKSGNAESASPTEP